MPKQLKDGTWIALPRDLATPTNVADSLRTAANSGAKKKITVTLEGELLSFIADAVEMGQLTRPDLAIRHIIELAAERREDIIKRGAILDAIAAQTIEIRRRFSEAATSIAKQVADEYETTGGDAELDAAIQEYLARQETP
jgi:hypothetical protein